MSQLTSNNLTIVEPHLSGQYRDHTADGIYNQVKRVMDLVVVLLSLPLLLPLMLLIALLIVLDSPGPIIYRQKRVGSRLSEKNGRVVWDVKLFDIYKFRTMFTNADENIHREYVKEWIDGNIDCDVDGDSVAKIQDDPRVTGVGRWLRKSSLDEIPQLFNILKGEMSLVGPRPVPEYEFTQYRPEHCQRLRALPGLTGLWQIKGRGNVTFEEMMAFDIEYVQTRTIRQDMVIVLLTIPRILSGSGAS